MLTTILRAQQRVNREAKEKLKMVDDVERGGYKKTKGQGWRQRECWGTTTYDANIPYYQILIT